MLFHITKQITFEELLNLSKLNQEAIYLFSNKGLNSLTEINSLSLLKNKTVYLFSNTTQIIVPASNFIILKDQKSLIELFEKFATALTII